MSMKPPLTDLPIKTAEGGFYHGFSLDVTVISKIIISALVVWAIFWPIQSGVVLNGLNGFILGNFAAWYIWVVALFVIVCIGLAIWPTAGRLNLGQDGEGPEFSNFSWFSMMFGAGIGVGMLTWAVAEPVTHFGNNPEVIQGLTTGAGADNVRMAYKWSFLHWGLGAWACYAVTGLSLAFFSYRRGLPLTIRSAFYPVLGERVWGWPGHIIDTLAVFATLFGLATSLGLGATQANAGLNELFGVPIGATTQVLLISGISAVATVSVLRGLDGGVKRLSELNMGLAFLLLVFVLIVGPTLLILQTFGSSLLAYLEYLPALANPVGREDVNFVQGWTSFYWAWWISWSPFVGMFIARVSRGRTVREFLVCVLLIPSVVCVLWMSVFGGVAIQQVIQDGYTVAQEAELPRQLFAMLNALPWAGITSLIGIVLVIVFFVTSSDSGSLVIDTITAGGKVNAPVPQRVFWCIFEGAVAIVLLLSAGGLKSLQSMVISTGLPFTVVLLFMCYAIYKGLRSERANT